MSKDESRFWIIFDTCTRPEYYQDVHNLLALPKGATLRYEYRDTWLSEDAASAAANPTHAPAAVVLVYAQWVRFQKEQGKPPASTPGAEMLWTATRVGEVALIPPPEGDNYFFDIKVMEYPRVDDDVLMSILDALIDAHEVPFHKWVSVSAQTDALAQLRRGRDDDNWQSIVNRLGVPPMQFAGDAFWRAKGPFDGKTGWLIEPKYERQRRWQDSGFETRGVDSYYELCEGDSSSLELVSHTPPGRHHPQSRVQVQCGDGPVRVVGPSVLDLRQYTSIDVTLRAERDEGIAERIAKVSLESPVGEGGWPTGARLLLTVKIQKRRWKVIAACVCVLLAAALAILTPGLYGSDQPRAIATGIASAVFIVLASLLWSGRPSFRV